MDERTMTEMLEAKVALADANKTGLVHLTAEDEESLIGILGEQEPGWISVKDRLPDQYGEYLAVVSGEVMEVTFYQPIRYYKDGRKWSTCNAEGFEWLNDGDVTHWMPLPEPPKEE